MREIWKIDTTTSSRPGYRNLKQLLFHNNFADASLLREKMAYDMLHSRVFRLDMLRS